MEKEKVDQFMMANAKFFPPMMVGQIKEKLATLDEDKETMLMSTDWKNPTVGLLFAFFLGGLGIDRFWLARNRSGYSQNHYLCRSRYLGSHRPVHRR